METATREWSVLLKEVPAGIREALNADAAAQDTSVNDAAVRVLSYVYGIPYEPSGRSYRRPGGSNDLVIRVPPELYMAIARDATERHGTLRGIVAERVAHYYGVPFSEGVRRRPRTTKQQPA